MEKRICTKCEVEKSIKDFGWRNRSQGKRHTRCRFCMAAYQREWCDRNRDKKAATDRRWREKNRERTREYDRRQAKKKDPVKRRALTQRWHQQFKKRDPEGYKRYQRTNHLQVAYHITQEQYNERVRLQNGRCMICGREGVPLVIDHDHQTGQIRGLLCSTCNTGIGLLHEDVDALYRAICYLQPLEKV